MSVTWPIVLAIIETGCAPVLGLLSFGPNTIFSYQIWNGILVQAWPAHCMWGCLVAMEIQSPIPLQDFLLFHSVYMHFHVTIRVVSMLTVGLNTKYDGRHKPKYDRFYDSDHLIWSDFKAAVSVGVIFSLPVCFADSRPQTPSTSPHGRAAVIIRRSSRQEDPVQDFFLESSFLIG